MGGGLGLLGWLVVGLIAGWIAEKATQSDHGLLTNLVVGIAGALVGGFLAKTLGLVFFGFLGSLIVATLGAVLLLVVWRMIRG